MSDAYWLWAWGGVGALIFAGPVLAMKLNSDPGDDAAADRRRRRLALWIAVLAVMTGAVTSQAFATVAQEWAARLVKLPRTAAALIVGVSANFLWPKIVRRLGQTIDKDDMHPPGGTT